MDKLISWLTNSCQILGIHIEIAYSFVLENGRSIQCVARILGMGAENGMLIFEKYDHVKDVADDITRAGFGYSVLDIPRSNEEFDLQSFKEMYEDWGWIDPKGDS